MLVMASTVLRSMLILLFAVCATNGERPGEHSSFELSEAIPITSSSALLQQTSKLTLKALDSADNQDPTHESRQAAHNGAHTLGASGNQSARDLESGSVLLPVSGVRKEPPVAAMQTKENRSRLQMLSTDPGDEGAVDEPESAPEWYMTVLIGFGSAISILLILVFLLHLLELMVQRQQQYHEELIEAGRQRTPQRPSEAAPVEQHEEAHLENIEVVAVLNGDPARLCMLLEFAAAKSPKESISALVKTCCTANKLRLSKLSESQIVAGLLSLATAASTMNRRWDTNVAPRARITRAFREVRQMVRLERYTHFHHKEHEWTEDHPDQSQKYHDGEHGQSHVHSSIKAADHSAMAAYFASEKWIDHAGIAIIIFYVQICGIIYAYYLAYRFPKMYVFMGPWVLVSRGEAMSLILTTMTMVLLLTRSFMTWVRKYVGWSTVLSNIVDKHTMMHQYCGMMLPVWAILHVIGHLKGSIPAIVNETDKAKVEAVFTYGTKIKFNFNSWSEAGLCYPAVTGYGLIIILIAFWSLSNSYVRRRWFELFHYPHLVLIVLWNVMLWAHGARQWLGVGVPLGLIGVAPIVAFYFISRTIDVYHGIDPQIRIHNATIKAKSVLLEINTEGSSFTYHTGMYCMVKIPASSNFEWHPFTIASAGDAPIVRVLFALAGDWTKDVKELLEAAQTGGKPWPDICLRGGYGAPAEGMKNSRHIVMVGAGVGATPFLSFLATVCRDAQQGKKSQFDGVETAVFYWVSREPEDFAWVNEYSSVIAATPSLKDRVSVRLCLSKSLETSATPECSAAQIAMFWAGAQIALRNGKAVNLAKELGAPTQFGRPNWKKELKSRGAELTRLFPSEVQDGQCMDVGVYVCGNPMLVESLEEACDESSASGSTVRFSLFAEQF